MIKVLIAEDEYLVRVGLHTCIDWAAHGYALLNDAVDGQDAYQKIVSLRPDILLLDLNMPKLTGLELLKRLAEEHISVSTVVVSCYDDFENVRAAFRYGAVDYINKLSMTPAEMLDVLSRVKLAAAGAAAGEAPEAEEEAARGPEALFKHAALSGARLQDPLPDALSGRRVLTVCITQSGGAKGGSLPLLLNVARQIIKNSGVEPLLCGDGEDNVCAALPAQCDVKAIAAALGQHLGPTLNCKTAIGIGPAYTDAAGLAESIARSGQIRNEVFWGRGGIRAYTEPLSYTNAQVEAFSAFKTRLSAQIRAMNLVGILGVVDEYCAYYAAQPDFPGDAFRKFSLSLIELFNARGESLQTDAFFHFQKVVMNARTAEAISEAITQLVHQSYINSPLSGSASYSPIVARAVEYIVKNPGKMYQLSEMAQLVNVSESYLGQLFKKETGMNFITYEHRYKVNIAKQLLDEAMLVYEVCEKVGFDSGNYFAKIFKRFTGLSPTEYRSKTK